MLILNVCEIYVRKIAHFAGMFGRTAVTDSLTDDGKYGIQIIAVMVSYLNMYAHHDWNSRKIIAFFPLARHCSHSGWVDFQPFQLENAILSGGNLSFHPTTYRVSQLSEQWHRDIY